MDKVAFRSQLISLPFRKTPHILSALLSFTLLSSFNVPLSAASAPTPYALDQAIEVALENNRLRTISQQSLAIAEAQYQQALSSHWPSLDLNLGFQHRDDAIIFEYPQQSLDVAPGLLPPVTVPQHEVSMLGRDSSRYSLKMTYPLYTGGRRSSLIEQAKLGVDIATQEVRRSDLQVVQDVKRYYYAALYSGQLVELAKDITLSFEVLRDITQTFFEGGSTRHRVSAAKSAQAKMEQQRLLLSDAVATQVKNLFLQTRAAQKQVEITRQTLATSRENRNLTRRAYQTGAVETQDVIKANLYDAMIHANHYRAMHDQALYLAEISYLLGKMAIE